MHSINHRQRCYATENKLTKQSRSFNRGKASGQGEATISKTDNNKSKIYIVARAFQTEIFSMASKKQLNPAKSASRNLQQPRKIDSTANKTAPSQRIAYSIAHTIPGRVRFRIPRLAKDLEYADKLKLAIESDSRTTSVRINPTAASIVINYQRGAISERQMRSHLVNLIQTAPNVVLPTPVTARSILGTIFDALINLIDSTRKINQARNAIVYRQFRTDIWERLLSSAKTVIKGLRSTMMFILPHKRSLNASKKSGLQPISPALDNRIVPT